MLWKGFNVQRDTRAILRRQRDTASDAVPTGFGTRLTAELGSRNGHRFAWPKENVLALAALHRGRSNPVHIVRPVFDVPNDLDGSRLDPPAA
jgi:hypothetical protein